MKKLTLFVLTLLPLSGLTLPASGPCRCGQSKAPAGLRIQVGMPGKPGFPAVLTGGNQLTFVVESLNESDKPLKTFGSGVGGELQIYRHQGKEDILVTTLSVPQRKDGAPRTVAPHAPISQTAFPWPQAAGAPPGKYVARSHGVEVIFELPWTSR